MNSISRNKHKSFKDMFMDEDTTDFSALEDDFPFHVEVVTVVRNSGLIRLTNKRDAPVIFKVMVLDPDSILLKPSTGRLEGKCSVDIHVKKRQTKRQNYLPQLESRIKFLVSVPSQCDCENQKLRGIMFEKTVTLHFEEKSEFSLMLKSFWEKVHQKDVAYMKHQRKRIFLFAVACVAFTVGIVFFDLHKKICSKPDLGFKCSIPLIWRIFSSCSPSTKWTDTISSKICSS